uniref:Uncharacterized protein n=1 Tax=Plectus sambesii TaxID=2011161 RepID=A0A914WXR8_9BILA
MAAASTMMASPSPAHDPSSAFFHALMKCYRDQQHQQQPEVGRRSFPGARQKEREQKGVGVFLAHGRDCEDLLAPGTEPSPAFVVVRSLIWSPCRSFESSRRSGVRSLPTLRRPLPACHWVLLYGDERN